MATFLISMEETDSNFVAGIPEEKIQQKVSDIVRELQTASSPVIQDQ